MAQPRRLWYKVFKNFINSFKVSDKAILIGKDHFGSEYYEFPHKSRRGKKNRWCVPREYDNFEQEIPVEWEAWLRHRREDPPTEEEIQINFLKKMQTIEKSKKLDKSEETNIKHFNSSKFPIYKEFEEEPGPIKK